MRYFITFACYGAHLHGNDNGSVDRRHNIFGTRPLLPNPPRAVAELRRMNHPAYELDKESRPVVLETIQQVCKHRGWNLLAAHVRSNHVHVIVEAEVPPEKVMNDFKAYASRALNNTQREHPTQRWARHGSTRWLWKDQDVRNAIHYVVDEQGPPMSSFVGDVP